jgi:uncharacterized LabA/DUF88 family protein
LSKNVAVFVDVANLYYSARGQDVDVDYVALLKAATKGRDLVRAYAYSGLDPENENQRKFIDFLTKNGYKVVHKDIRKFGDGRVKANLDIELVVDLFRVKDRMDIAVIVSGDGDFAPAIRALQDVGVRCEVISFRPNTSSDLIAVADEFTDIMKIASISRDKAARGMSAPPMPAKEVEPDFAFREASPAVAAAALAALKGGTPTRGGRGRGRAAAQPRSEAHPTPEEPAEHEAPAAAGAVAGAAHDENGEGHRRRRRRGGRGRGRRGHAEEGEAAAAPTEEIGWQELDDLSQLVDLDEEPEYAFEEADPETLAELGIAAEAPSTAAAEAPAAEEATKPRRRRRAATAEAAPADQTAPAAEATEPAAEEPPKPRRRGRAAKATETQAETGEAPEGGEAAKPVTRSRRTRKTESGETPKPEAAEAAQKRRRTRKTETAPAEAGAEGSTGSASEGAESQEPEAQGIWQRFRSARTPR